MEYLKHKTPTPIIKSILKKGMPSLKKVEYIAPIIITTASIFGRFSSAFSLLAQKLGFKCMLVVGDSSYSSTSFTSHAWNIIKIQDKYYHMDITWDTRKFFETGEFSYDYFANNDFEIKADHKWKIKDYPTCISFNFSFYKKRGLIYNNFDNLRSDIIVDVKNKINVFRYRLSNDISISKDIDKLIADFILNEMLKYKEKANVNYYWNEYTRYFFAKLTI